MKILNSPLNIETMGASDNFAHTKVFNDRVYYTTISADNKGVSVASTDINGNDKRHEIPDGIYIKTKINVYGGICFCPTDFGVVFSNSKDGELYLVNNEGLKQLTSSQQYNYGDISYNNNLILFVAEERNGHFPKQHIGQIDLNTNEYNIIDQGADFYHAPQSDTDKTIWLEWNLPHMPWDNSAVIMLENNNKTILSDGIGHFQPLLNNGNVYYAKDTGEYFNIFKNSQNIFKTDIDFYMPLWVYGMTTYTVINDTVIACGTENGDWVIGKLSNDGFNKIKTDYVYFDGLTGNDNTVSFVGRKSNKPSEVVIMNNDKKTIIDCGKDLPINDDYISAPKKVNFKNETNDTIYAYYYAPKNPEYDNTIPPLIVKSHSGPTGQATTEYNPKIQFWTSRGFAVLDVNYSGSTGFGSHYRNRLNGRWGEIDVKELEL
ncbi:MAG: alpha/beta hydrolase family protein, partial [Alphaproteobacteria bacterium]